MHRRPSTIDHRPSLPHNFTHFDRWWEQVITFQLHWDFADLRREIRYWGGLPRAERTADNFATIRVWAAEQHEVLVESPCGRPLRYWLGIWDTPPNSETPGISMSDLAGYVEDKHQLFFAADLDRQGCFHVNNWPAVQAYLSRVEA